MAGDATNDIAEKPRVMDNSRKEGRETSSTSDTPEVKPHRIDYVETDGYIVDVEGGDHGYKLAADGHTKLIPQPSTDPADPLNWSFATKHIMLLIVSCAAFLPDYGSAVGAVTLLAQAGEWGLTPDDVNKSQAGNVFMLGVGGVVVVILSAFLGRLPVLFWFLVFTVPTAAWCAAATNLDSFMAARILNGFFSTVAQGGGLMFIQDMFFFHERARKINIWASFVIVSPYMGPLLTAFMMTTKPWPIPFWVYTAMTAACLVATALFLRETYYDRRIPADAQPLTNTSRVAQLTGIAQFKSRGLRISFAQACKRNIAVFLKPTVLLACLYYALTFAWAVGINTTLAMFLTPLYGFEVLQVGYFYFTPIVAAILGEIAGHWLHDAIARQYVKKHGGRFEPEVRLRAIIPALPFMVVGLVLIGSALQQKWHYMATAVAWGLYVFGIMITTVAVSSYCLDSYPEASGEVSAWINFSRTVGGFIVSYLQVSWALAQGTATSFGIQGAVVAAAFLIVVVLMKWGKAMRLWAGPLHSRD